MSDFSEKVREWIKCYSIPFGYSDEEISNNIDKLNLSPNQIRDRHVDGLLDKKTYEKTRKEYVKYLKELLFLTRNVPADTLKDIDFPVDKIKRFIR